MAILLRIFCAACFIYVGSSFSGVAQEQKLPKAWKSDSTYAFVQKALVFPWLQAEVETLLQQARCLRGDGDYWNCTIEHTTSNYQWSGTIDARGIMNIKGKNRFGRSDVEFTVFEVEGRLLGQLDFLSPRGGRELQYKTNVSWQRGPCTYYSQFWPRFRNACSTMRWGTGSFAIRYYDSQGRLLAHIANSIQDELTSTGFEPEAPPAYQPESGNPPTLAQLEKRNGRYYLPGSREEYTGLSLDYQVNLESLRPAMLYHFKDGLPHGPFTHCNRSGQVFLSGFYHEGLLQDTVRLKGVNDLVQLEMTFRSGKLHTYKEYMRQSEKGSYHNSKSDYDLQVTFENVPDAYRLQPGLDQLGPALRHLHRPFVSEIQYRYYWQDATLRQRNVETVQDSLKLTRIWQYHKTGELLAYQEQHNGLTHGMAWEYYTNGQLHIERPFYQGRLEGTWKMWSDKGTLMRKEEYHNGAKNGWTEHYYGDGTLHLMMQYKDGVPQGEMVQYRHGTDSIQQITRFIDGNNDFEELRYHPNGQQSFYKRTTRSKIEGEVTQWHPNGQVQSILRYKKGQPIGPNVYYDASGRLLGKERFHRDGEKTGRSVKYHPNGQVASVQKQWYGMRVGKALEYYPNGQLATQGQYLQDERHGTWRHWRADGTLLAHTWFQNGEAVGQWHLTDAQGRFAAKVRYRDGGLTAATATMANGTTTNLWPMRNLRHQAAFRYGLAELNLQTEKPEKCLIQAQVQRRSGQWGSYQFRMVFTATEDPTKTFSFSVNDSFGHLQGEVPPGNYKVSCLYHQNMYLGEITLLPGTLIRWEIRSLFY